MLFQHSMIANIHLKFCYTTWTNTLWTCQNLRKVLARCGKVLWNKPIIQVIKEEVITSLNPLSNATTGCAVDQHPDNRYSSNAIAQPVPGKVDVLEVLPREEPTVDKLEGAYPTKDRIHLFCDNARYYRNNLNNGFSLWEIVAGCEAIFRRLWHVQ